jgi:hypothetical protein
MRRASLAVLGCLLLAVAATGATGCSSSAAPAAPREVATLHVTNGYPQHPVTLDPKTARVPKGSTFSVTVDTSDGPVAWELTSVGHPAIVQKQGSAPVGSCGSPPKAGCTVPRRYTFLAKAPGTTTIVWTEYALGCAGQAGHRCAAVIQPITVTVTS